MDFYCRRLRVDGTYRVNIHFWSAPVVIDTVLLLFDVIQLRVAESGYCGVIEY